MFFVSSVTTSTTHGGHEIAAPRMDYVETKPGKTARSTSPIPLPCLRVLRSRVPRVSLDAAGSMSGRFGWVGLRFERAAGGCSVQPLKLAPV